MRFILPTIGIVVLIATGTALQNHFSSNRVVAETALGAPVYDIPADYVKTLPEQEIPLP
jgi:hypothetical protein